MINPFNQSLIENGVRYILKGLGCDLKDRNFTDTPERYARAMLEMFQPPEVDYATFEEDHTDFILLHGHKLWSLCPHHLFPVSFTVSLAYIPNGEVLGLSKLARLLHDINRGPLLQERFTAQVVKKVRTELPKCGGSACIVHGVHGCAQMRGVHTKAEFTTYRLEGLFEKDATYEHRFFELVRRQI